MLLLSTHERKRDETLETLAVLSPVISLIAAVWLFFVYSCAQKVLSQMSRCKYLGEDEDHFSLFAAFTE